MSGKKGMIQNRRPKTREMKRRYTCICKYCQQPFKACYPDTKFCKNYCNVRYWKLQRALQKYEKTLNY